jgi:NAD-dependent deacetylase
MSTESNIPDFRGTQGLWKLFDPRMAARSYFLEDPKGFWGFYAKRYEKVEQAEPNNAHRAIAELERRGCLKAIVTQNIDRLHTKAGALSVMELHGNITQSRCDRCLAECTTVDIVRRYLDDDEAPRCEICGGYMRPCIVLFDEPVERMDGALSLARKSDLALAVGSSLCVYPAALVPEVVKEMGGKLVIINLEPTPMDGMADLVIRGKASSVLMAILKRVAEIQLDENRS